MRENASIARGRGARPTVGRLVRSWATVSLVLLATSLLPPRVVSTRTAQQAHAGHRSGTLRLPRDLVERPTSIRQGIGAVQDRITTSSPDAQRFYNQGLAYLHSFSWIDAARSFHQALRLDPRLAMAQVGLSYAFSGLNAPSEARAALERARLLAGAATSRERRRIEIRARELDAESDSPSPSKRTAYPADLDRALADDPTEVELWLLRGHASAAADAPRYYRARAPIVPDYFAAHHYLAHAYEDLGRIDSALRHSEAFARLAPAVPHAHHMYGHDLLRSGRVDEAIAAFSKAYDLERQYYEIEQIAPEHDWHHLHNLSLLAASYQYVGETKPAADFFQRAFSMPSLEIVEALNKRAWPLFLLSRGRTQDALSAARTLTTDADGIVRAAGHVMAGQAALALGRLPSAADAANAALAELRGPAKWPSASPPISKHCRERSFCGQASATAAARCFGNRFVRCGPNPVPMRGRLRSSDWR